MLFVAPELAPWAKAGGLGEVAHDLPRALRAAGADVRVLVPAYPALRAALRDAREVARLDAPGGALAPARLLQSDAPLPAYLVACDACYARVGDPYGGPDGRDWPDNALRFGLLSRVAAWLGAEGSPLDWKPDIVHCNDWPCGPAPAYLANAAGTRAATVMTIHNLAFHGLFGRDVLGQLGLPPETFAPEGLEFHGHVSFLKAGLHYATRLSTVSPTYAAEIQQPELGFGLEGLLRRRAADLRGIVNGIDTDAWNPATDAFLAAPYDAGRLDAKALNKAALQRELGLRADARAPLAGVVSRLVEQKGIDLVVAAADALLADGAQLIILGRGTPAIEDACRALAARNPGTVAARLEFSEALAHRIEAGADLFLMPSRFEPCGLNQQYSMRYGTPPVARRTGGLADTVVDATDGNLRAGRATGFVFDAPTPEALLDACRRAIACYRDAPRWAALQRAGMAREPGWDAAAREYLALYADALGR